MINFQWTIFLLLYIPLIQLIVFLGGFDVTIFVSLGLFTTLNFTCFVKEHKMKQKETQVGGLPDDL